MRVAIFSDVHGNLTALEAVLADIEKQAPDFTYFAGDLCLFGARPGATLTLLREHQHILPLYGNTDEWLWQVPEITPDMSEKKKAHTQYLQASATWAKAQMSDDDLEWLETIPFAHRLSPSTNRKDDLLVCHANPQDVNAPIFPTAEEQQLRVGEVQKAQSDEEIRPLLQNTNVGIIAFGHVHFPNVRQVDDIILANISAISIPQDGETRARYGLLTWSKANGWQVERHHVTYDLSIEQAELAKSQPPNWEKLSQLLEGKR